LRLRAGRPADPSQGVDERAALDPKGATDRSFRRTAIERRDDGRHFFDVDRDRTAAAPTATSGCFETGSHPLLGQGPLKLSQRPEDMKQKFTLRSGGIHLLGQRPERDPAFLEVVYSREQGGERSPAPTGRDGVFGHAEDGTRQSSGSIAISVAIVALPLATQAWGMMMDH
jgi:hypothetical protein